jgi:F-type H+/Na+-transporting ATPase subunit alpha
MSKYLNKTFEDYLNQFSEVGKVKHISYPLVKVDGLPSTFQGEIVVFENGTLGQVTSIKESLVEVLVFSEKAPPIETSVARTGDTLKIPVGDDLLGKVITPLGKSLHGAEPLSSLSEYRYIERESPGIAERVEITKPLETGVTVVDLMVPLGKGQRELIIGDRKTGKTNFLLQTMLTQARKGTICIYAAIGKRKADVLKVEKFFKDNNLKEKTISVVSNSTDSSGVIYLTPYSAMAIAEYFKDMGKDVLLILDDLSIHAKFYREISLLGRNFPGRNSYPGDIFYTHGRLVERAGNFKTKEGTVSLTCLPIAETVEGDISGYIQTNLMSMTDGHIYFDRDLFAQGRRPAINFFLSVTRVGRQTQSAVRSGINRELSSFLTLYEKTQSFVHFGAELSAGVKTTLAMGDKVLDFFNQQPSKILGLDLQVMLFCLIWVGIWNEVSLEEARIELEKIKNAYESSDEVRALFAQYLSEASDFNALLGRVGGEHAAILQKVFSNSGEVK